MHGNGLSFGSALTTLIKKILTDSGEGFGLWGEAGGQLGLSSATIGRKWVEFILGVMLPEERIAGNMDFKMPLQNETSNCFMDEKYNCRWGRHDI